MEAYKLVLLGETAVGKSSLVLRFMKDDFRDQIESTIGAAYSTKGVIVEGDKEVRFEIWDTAGQERYHSLAPMYYRGAQAAIVVYDIRRRETFEKAKLWVAELAKGGNEGMVTALAGNKCDCSEKERQVDGIVARKYADEQGLIFMETSAKEATNVVDLFERIAQIIARKYRNRPRRSSRPQSDLALGRAGAGAGSANRLKVASEDGGKGCGCG